MKENIYAQLINEAPFAYALHEMVYDENGKAVDYIFREVNAAFEKMTGLEVKKIINKRVTKVLPEILNDEFNWIAFYGNLVKNNEKKEFEQYSSAMNEWFKIYAKAIDKDHFSTIFANVSNEHIFADSAKELTFLKDNKIDYYKMADCMRALSGASYVSLNIFEENGIEFTTVAISGIRKNIEKAISLSGYEFIGRKWSFDPKRHERIKDKKTTIFKNLFDLTESVFSKSINILLIKTFNIGEAVVVKTSKDDVTVGDFTLIFEHNKHLENIQVVESYADLCGSVILRLKAENELIKQKDELEDFFSVNLDLLCIANTDGYFIKLNKEWENVLGYKLSDLQGKRFLELVHPDDLEATFDAIKDLNAQKKVLSFINRYKAMDGSYRFIEWRSYPKGKLIYASARDISERIANEQLIKAKEEKYRSVLETALDGFFIADTAGKIYDVNTAICKMLGYTKEEFASLTIADIEAKETAEDVKQHIEQIKAQGTDRFETLLRRKDNTVIDVEISVTYFQFEHEQESKLIVFAKDITMRKLKEKALKEITEQAQAANNAKSQFLANMSHEIRTPLNSVIGFTELLSNTPLNHLQQKYVDTAMVSANALLGIITDVLDYSKIEADKLELDIVKTDIIELIEQAADILKHQAARKGLEFILNIEPNMPTYAYVDPLRLKQIIVNLLNNALKFTEKGEVELKISFEIINITKGVFHISVRDTGIGIQEKYSEKIFKAFAQADVSTTRQYGGTGLGLTISNLLAQKMGGSLSFITQEGKGTTFSFGLKTKYLFGRKKIYEKINNLSSVLVIDDNDRNRLILEHAFNNWGLRFTGVNSAYKALGIIENAKQFDLIIVDYHMPKMDGFSFIKRLKNKLKESFSEQPIIFLHSSYDDISVLEECEKLGVRFALTKPVKLRKLHDYLKNINTKSKFIKRIDKKTLVDDSFKPQSDKAYNILLVEDNFVNMTLLSSMLQTVLPNTRLYEAYNGLEALEIVKNHKLDLVFMDIQMPVMGGIDAAKQIRKSCDAKIRSVPIVALTAGATQKEKENCLEAGMNEFITKPINKETLFKVLNVFLYKNEKHNKDVSFEVKATDISTHFDIDGLKQNLNNDQKLIKKLLRASLKDYPAYMKKITHAAETNNEDEIREQAHALKGSALTIGFLKFGALVKEIEYNTKDTAKLAQLIAEMEKEWQIIKGIVAAFLKTEKL